MKIEFGMMCEVGVKSNKIDNYSITPRVDSVKPFAYRISYASPTGAFAPLPASPRFGWGLMVGGAGD